MDQKKWCTQALCPYFNRVEVPYAGDVNSDIVIVGESPSRDENLRQQPFIGPSGQVLQAVLDSIGYSRGSVCLTNSCRCSIDKDNDSVSTINTAMKTCRPKLSKIITQVKPKIVIALGAIALKQLTGKQKIMENRGQFFYSEELKCHIFCTVHPTYVLRGSSRDFWTKTSAQRTMKENLMFIDFERVRSFLETGKIDQIDTSLYREGTARELREIHQSAKIVAVDFETTGLDLFNPSVKCLSVSFTVKAGESLVYLADENGHFIPEVQLVLEASHINKIVAARPFEERICVQKLGFQMGGLIHDVLVMAHLLDENYHSYSLEAVADIYTPLKGIKEFAKGSRADLTKLAKEDLIKYNAVDTDATFRAFKAMTSSLKKDPKLLGYYAHFIQKIQGMFATLYFNGCLIDTDQLRKDERAIHEIIATLHEECLALIPEVIKEKHAGKLKLSRPALVQDYLFLHPAGVRLRPDKNYITPKTKKPQCTEDHLKLFPNVEFINKFLRLKKAEKILSTYTAQLWTVLKPDGRVYPSMLMTQTVTGRTVMKEPTIQTIPQRGEFAAYVKRAFVADEGWVFGARDLGQSEIRIMGWLAQDPVILDALAKNIDIHIKTASIVNSVPIEQVTKDMRQKAKGVNFGFLYGMGAYKFKFYAKNEYGVDYTDEQAEATREMFFSYPRGYHSLPKYYQKQERLVASRGFVQSVLGRYRRLPGAQSRDEKERREAYRQAINMPVQGFSSDLGLIGMYLFWKEIQKRPDLAPYVKIMWFIHDSVFFQAKEQYFARAMRLLKHCMEVESKLYVEKHFGVKIGYPITSDGKSGSSWATMKDWVEEEAA